MLDDAATVDPHVSVAELATHRQAAFYAAANARTDIGGLLIGLVAGKDGTHAPLHATCGCFAGWLVREEERHAGGFCQGFKVSPVSNVACSAINFYEQHAAESVLVALDVGSELAERAAFIALGRRLSDLEELDHGAAQPMGELGQASFLVLEAKAFFFLPI